MKFSKGQNNERRASLNAFRLTLGIWAEKKINDVLPGSKDLKPKTTVLVRFGSALFLHRIRSVAYRIKLFRLRSIGIKFIEVIAKILPSRR
jgi:hypothetical protein